MSAVLLNAISIHSNIPLRSRAVDAPWSWAGATVRTTQQLDAETSLIERCLGGEQGAWDELIKIHTKRVYGLCYRFTGRDNEAQDLTQDVFLRVFKSLGQLPCGRRVHS